MDKNDFGQGAKEEQQLRNGGFSDDEVNQWKSETADTLYKGGFTDSDVQGYFGKVEPDTKAMKTYVKDNLAAEAVKQKESGKPKEAMSYLDSFMSGLQLSTAGLIINQKSPDIILPEHADRAMKILSMSGTAIGDIPAMVVGGFLGALTAAPVMSAAGSFFPVIGNIGGAAAGVAMGGAGGSFALPTALRKMMMDHYERGDIKTSQEFFDRLASTTWETTKSAGIGMLTLGAGKWAAPFVGVPGKLAAEVATMTTVGAALEGHMPEADDFINAGIMVAGFHGAEYTSGKMRKVYAATGERPEAVIEAAGQSPTFKQELLSENPNQPMPDPKYETLKPEKNSAPFEVVSGAGEPGQFHVEKSESKIEAPSKWGEAYRLGIDDLDPVKSAVTKLANGQDVAPSKDPYKLMRTYKDYQGKVLRALKSETIDFNTGAANGEGLAKVLERVPDKEAGELSPADSKVLDSVAPGDRDNKGNSWGKFTSYLLSKRAVELEGRGIESGVDIASAKEVIAGGKEYEAHAQALKEYQSRIKQYAVDSGILSKDSSRAMDVLNENYVPFYRLMDDEVGTGKGSTNLFKQIKGSEREILDPIQSIHKNTEAIFRAAEKNRSVGALVKLAAENGNTELVKKVKAEQRPIEVKSQEITRALEDQGVITTKESVKRYLKEKGLELSDEQIEKGLNNEQGILEGAIEAFTIFRPKQGELRDNEFQVYKNGKREVYETAPELAEAVKGLDGHAGMTNMWYNVFLKGPAQLLRKGVTLSPDFIVRNYFRDQMTATIQSKYTNIPFVSSLEAIGHIWKKDSVWMEFLSSGGASGSFGEVSRYLENDVWGLNKQTGFMDRAWNVVKSPLDALAVVSELTENIPRLTEFKRAGGVGGSLDEKIEAAMLSRESTLDFARAGAKIRGVSQIIPFFNVAFQDADRTIRQFKENPAATYAKATAMVTLPTALLWWANKDDSRYKDAPNWEKDLFWIIPTDKWQKSTFNDAASRPDDLKRQLSDGSWEVNNGTTHRLPKPFLYGMLFGSLPERALNAFYKKDPDQFRDFSKTIIGGLAPNIMPTAITPIVEQAVNKSFFTGNQVVSNQMEKYLPEYQYQEYTSETAKQLGKIIGAIPGLSDIGPKDAKLSSPLVVDNYIRDWTGSVGQYAIQMIDVGLRAAGVGDQAPKPLSTIADIPVIKAFVMRYPQAKLQPIEDFRQNFDETSKVVATVEMLAKRGDINAANKLMTAEQDSFIKMNGINQALANQNIMIQKINQHPSMSPNDKRQLIDSIYFQMSQSANMGNQLLKEYRNSLNH